MATTLELQREAKWRLYEKDQLAFAREVWHIRHPTHGKILFPIRPAQVHTLHVWNTERYSVALKARQIGFSTLAGMDAVWRAFFHPDRFEVMLSKSEREAMKLLLKAKYGYKWLPEWMHERGPKLLDNNLTKMSWDNDSAIESLPSNNDPARGESVDRVYVDEWAFLPNPEEAWASIEPVADIGGSVVGISTANGSGNFFHKLYVQACEGTNGFTPIFFPWSANTERDETWYDQKKRLTSGTPWILHQEYPRNDVECFIKSGMSVFDTDELEQMKTEKPKQRGVLVPLDRQGFSRAAKFVDADDGPLHIWQAPVKDGRRYVVGADTAQGLEHGDYSSAHVIDTKTGLVVAKWRGRIDPDLFGSNTLWHIGWLYGGALLGVEANNMGAATLAALRNRGYPNIYYRTSLLERTSKQTRQMGWYTSSASKPIMIAELAKALRLDTAFGPDGEEVVVPGEIVVRDSETIAELKTYVREADGKTMHGSPHDDQVMSLGIANQMRAFAFSSEWQSEEVDPWSMQGWDDFYEEMSGDDEDSFLIGAHNTRR